MYLVVRLQGKKMTEAFAAAGYNFFPEHFMILTFLDMKKEMNQIDLAQNTIKSKATITRAIDKLVDLKMISKIPGINDRRHNIITLTERGKFLYNELRAIYNKITKNALKEIPQNELECCLNVIRKTLANKWLIFF